MNTTLKLAGTAFLLTGFVTLAGCSSDDSSGAAIAPPPNAIVLDDTNAVDTAMTTIDTTGMLLGKGTTQTASAGNIIGQVLDQIRDNQRNSGIDLVAGITEAHSDTRDCVTDLTTTNNTNIYTEVGNYTPTATGGSDSGTVTFVSCEMAPGTTIDGKISYNGKWSSSDDSYTDNASGNLTMTTGSLVIALKNFSFKETGNDFTGDYEISVMQYVYNPGTDGFAVKTTTPITGNVNDICDKPSAGVVLISGAVKTRVRATFGVGGILTVEIDTGDGVFTEALGNPVYMCP